MCSRTHESAYACVLQKGSYFAYPILSGSAALRGAVLAGGLSQLPRAGNRQQKEKAMRIAQMKVAEKGGLPPLESEGGGHGT